MLKRLRDRFLKVSPYRISVLIGIAFFLVLMVAGGKLDQLPVISPVENIFHDLKFKLRGPKKPSGDVVVAAVDEKAQAVLGRWPFQRAQMAAIVDKITALGAKAIVFDVAYVDAASEGAFAAAHRLQNQFDQMSIASPEGTDLLTKLTLAKTAIAGANSAAAGMGDSARDVKGRLEPVTGQLDDALKLLERYKTLNADFGSELEKEAGGANGDELFGMAVHKSPVVVLGSFLILKSEADQLTPAQVARELEAISYVRIPFPTVYPHELGDNDELLNEGRPIYNVHLQRFVGGRAPFDALIRKEGKAAQPQLSFFNTKPDRDGVIRREPFVLAVGPDDAAPDKMLLVPNIDLGGLLKYYDADPGSTRLWSNSEDGSQLEYVAILKGSAKGLQGQPKKKDFKTIRVDQEARLLLNYYGANKTFPNISIGDIWNGEVPKSQIDGKMVIIGATATGTYDQRVTPFDQIQPGVEIHATAMENVIHDEYLVRPWWATIVESLIIFFIALVVGRFLSKVRPTYGALVTFAVAGGYLVFDYGLFLRGIAVFNAFPVAEVLLIYMSQTVQRYILEEGEKNKVRNAFQLYLQPSVIDEMLKKQELPKLGGEKKILSVMFSDIRGFTTISEKLTPEQLAKLINEYLTPMTSLVFEHGGTLDKYIGDALMAIFGAPVEQHDHALRCCRTAVHMMRELAKLQERWRMEGNNYPPIDIGIGINSGPMVVGNMGGNQRFDYTVLGDNVNLASRLEGTNKEYRSHIIISDATYQLCDGQVAARELGAVRVKGKREPVRIYELMDDKPPTGEIAEVIGIFDAGIALFRQQKWDDAKAQFNKVLGIWPKDGPAAAYIEFTNDYEKDPPGADWDGVYTMTHK